MVLLSDKPVLNANDVENFIKVKEIRTPLKKSVKNQEASSNLPVLGEAIIRPYSSYESHSKEELLEAIKRAGGNKSRAAQNIGLTARQLVYRLKKLS